MVVLIRRIVTVLVGLCLAVLITVLLVNPESIEHLAFSLIDMSALIRVPVAVLIDIIVLAVIIVLVRSERAPHQASTGLIVKAQGAIADVSIESARDRILRAVREVPDVRSAEATVTALHGRADIDLNVTVSHSSANLPDKQRELDRALRQVINKQLGLQLAGKPRVHIRMEDEKLLTGPVEPSAPVPTPAPTPVVVAETKPETPVKLETVAPVKEETVAPADGMTLRGDSEPKSDAVTPPV